MMFEETPLVKYRNSNRYSMEDKIVITIRWWHLVIIIMEDLVHLGISLSLLENKKLTPLEGNQTLGTRKNIELNRLIRISSKS